MTTLRKRCGPGCGSSPAGSLAYRRPGRGWRFAGRCGVAGSDQQPRQIDPIDLSTLASSRSMAGLVRSGGPFCRLPMPLDESAVPDELVPGAAGLVPEAPPVTGMPPDEWCEPMPPPRAGAAGIERPTQRATQRTERVFMPKLPLTRALTQPFEMGSALNRILLVQAFTIWRAVE